MIKTYLTREIVPEYIVDRAQAILGHPLPERLVYDVDKTLYAKRPYALVQSVRFLKYPSGYSSIEMGWGLIKDGKVRPLDRYFADLMSSVRAIFGWGNSVYFDVYVTEE